MLRTAKLVQRSPELPRPRTLVHPGRFNPVRIQAMHCERARHLRVSLMPGLNLVDALVQPLAAVGVHNASITILGGLFETLQYCVAPPDPSRHAVVAYTRPLHAGRAYMVFGNATVGKGLDGDAVVHCHAAIRTERGEMKGGHIIARSSIVGPEPIFVLVTSLEGFELRVSFDPETNIALLQPHRESGVE